MILTRPYHELTETRHCSCIMGMHADTRRRVYGVVQGRTLGRRDEGQEDVEVP